LQTPSPETADGVLLCTNNIMKNNRIIIFDTTLRDGEQCPGASMNLREKLAYLNAVNRFLCERPRQPA